MKPFFTSILLLLGFSLAMSSPSAGSSRTFQQTTSGIDSVALYRKLSASNIQNVGTETVLGTVYVTRTQSYNTLELLNAYLKEKLVSSELNYILANPNKFLWRVTYGDRRGSSAGLVSRVKSYEFSSSASLSGYILPEVYTLSPYSHALTFNGASLTLTDKHFGVNVYGSLRGLTVQVRPIVSFNSNGGSAVSSLFVNPNTALSKPSDPTRAGYIFGGWYSDAGLTIVYNFASAVSQSITLYAKWNVSVIFNSNGGSAVSSISVATNTALSKPSDPSRSGYAFGGWYSDTDLTIAYNFASAVSQSITLYAKWSKPYVVRFISNLGSNVSEQMIAEGGMVQTPVSPTREGYDFGGWYTNNQWISLFRFDMPIMRDTTLYAKWTKRKYKVSFDMNGGIPNISFQEIERGERVTNPPTPNKTGYRFAGWNKEVIIRTEIQGLQTRSELYNFDLPVEENINLKAQWEVSQSIATTSSVSPSEVKLNRKVVQLRPDVSGYLEYGGIKRKLVSSNTGEASSESGAVIKGLYQVDFLSNGGNSIASQQVEYKGRISLPTPSMREGYRFVGWYMDQGLTKPIDVNVIVARDYTLYAKWQRVYIISFNSNGGDVVSNQLVDEGTMIVSPSNVTKMGCSFGGWYTNASLTSAYNFSSAVTQAMTLYAKWNVTVTFNSNGGSAIASQTVQLGGVVSRPTDPTRTDYDFGGWYSDAGLTSVYNFSIPITQSTTLYAKWVSKYAMLTFDIRGGRGRTTFYYHSQWRVLKGNTFHAEYRGQYTDDMMNYIAKDGYSFGGWFSDTLFSVAVDLRTTIFTADTKLYAKWNPVVTFNSNGGSAIASQTVQLGGVVSRPTDPTRFGYVFVGWYSDAGLTSVYNFSSAVRQGMILYAKWNPVPVYTVTFDVAGGDYISPQSVESGKSATYYIPKRPNYIFNGWLISGTSIWYDFSPVTGNITLQASWTYYLLRPIYEYY